ncbi:MAG: hypothetical protein ACTSVB_01545 [Candidatus Heimdallarchaeaceae archaeon]
MVKKNIIKWFIIALFFGFGSKYYLNKIDQFHKKLRATSVPLYTVAVPRLQEYKHFFGKYPEESQFIDVITKKTVEGYTFQSPPVDYKWIDQIGYKTTKTDTLLYWFGPDGKDNGGIPYNKEEIEKLKKSWWPFHKFPKGDVVTSIEYPDLIDELIKTPNDYKKNKK